MSIEKAGNRAAKNAMMNLDEFIAGKQQAPTRQPVGALSIGACGGLLGLARGLSVNIGMSVLLLHSAA